MADRNGLAKRAWAAPRSPPWPNHRAPKRGFGRRIYSKDIENMREEYARHRKVFVGLKRENKTLKTSAKRLVDILKRKDVSLHRVLACKAEESDQAIEAEKHYERVRELRNDLLSISRLSERIRQLEATLAERKRTLAETREMVQGVKVSDLKLDMKRNFEKASKLSRILSRLAKKLSVQKEEKVEGAKSSEANLEPKSARGEQMPVSLASKALSLPIQDIEPGSSEMPQSARGVPNSARDRKLVFQPRSARRASSGSEQAEGKDSGTGVVIKATDFGLADDGYVYVRILQDDEELARSPPAACMAGKVEWAQFSGLDLKKGSGIALEFHEVDETGENMDNIVSTAILPSAQLKELSNTKKVFIDALSGDANFGRVELQTL